jgi:hypothetical protein
MALKVSVNNCERIKDIKYQRGDIIIFEDGGNEEIAMICQMDTDTYCLIDLQDGNRWDDPVKCYNDDDLIELLKDMNIIKHLTKRSFSIDVNIE